jgi:hypothetical protein
VQVREEHLGHGVHGKARLYETRHRPAPGIEQQAFAASLDERADPCCAHMDTRSARGSQQRDANRAQCHGATPLRGRLRSHQAGSAEEQNRQEKPERA